MADSDKKGRTTGKEAHRTNIAVIQELAEDVRSTLGPKGMDKMIVDGLGDIIVTNDGYTLLTEMRIKHPTAKLAVEAAVTQQEKVGDGTTTVIVLAGEFLRRTQTLLDMNIHPAVIARGFRRAERMAQELLTEFGETVNLSQDDVLLSVAQTAMTGKGAEAAKEHLSKLALEGVRKIADNGRADAIPFDGRDLKLERMVGSSLDQSELINGVLISRERAHPHMPTEVKNARVAIIEQPLEIKNPELTAQIQINDPSQMQAFIEQEQRTLAELAARVASSGCNVLFCQQNIEEPADYFLSKAGILAVRRVPQSDLVRIAKATGAKIVSHAMVIEKSDLGNAGRVREETRGRTPMIFVEECKNPKSVTFLVKAGTEHAAEEARRAVEDAIGDITSIIQTGKIVAGAGAIEIRLKRSLQAAAKAKLAGKDRLIVEAFAEALLVIPRTLIESAGEDPIDVISTIEQRQEAGEAWVGYDVVAGEIANAWQRGILEPMQIKTQAIGSATEVAVMILRIDDIFIGETRDK